MGTGSNDYRAAERRLMDAIRAGDACDFADGAEITATEMDSWGPERTVGAVLLRHLLTTEDALYAKRGILLRGAAVEGVLDLKCLDVMHLELRHCRLATVDALAASFTGDVSFDHATFNGLASFHGATFAGDASFDHATFTSNASFDDATFTSNTSFDHGTFNGLASFPGATFAGDASFDHATFTSNASFDHGTFNGLASFDHGTFNGLASFPGATFTGEASFNSVNFNDLAGFYCAIFTGDASFDDAIFTGDAVFLSATFTGDASFRSVNFTGNAWFYKGIAQTYDLMGAQFHTADPGPWVARRVKLSRAIFHVRARVAIAAAESDFCRFQAREGVHLLICGGGVVDLEDAEFPCRSILAHSAIEPAVPERPSQGECPEDFEKFTPRAQAQRTAQEKAFWLSQELIDELSPPQAKPTRVVSLRRATAGDLVLSGIGLDDCAFAGTHGLDKLRIDATCSFQRPPAWPWRTWRPFTGRQVIFEETQWRRAHTRGWGVGTTPPPDGRWTTAASNGASARAERDHAVPTALGIAGIYRDLRKGLEDAKDEPGAADFYYGEMEMRRLAARGHRHQNNSGGAGGRRPSWTERRLLDAYWAVSGYGLRAWRALTALTILLVGCAALFTLPVFVKPHPGAAVTFAKSLEFTARESLTLIRTSGTPTLQVTSAGTAVDIALRLLAPLLLGLAVLAIRGRIKR